MGSVLLPCEGRKQKEALLADLAPQQTAAQIAENDVWPKGRSSGQQRAGMGPVSRGQFQHPAALGRDCPGEGLPCDCGKEWGLQSQPSALEREEGEFLLEGVAQPQGWTHLGAVREAESRLFAG